VDVWNRQLVIVATGDLTTDFALGEARRWRLLFRTRVHIHICHVSKHGVYECVKVPSLNYHSE
jgi:hypothetical protein